LYEIVPHLIWPGNKADEQRFERWKHFVRLYTCLMVSPLYHFCLHCKAGSGCYNVRRHCWSFPVRPVHIYRWCL